MNFLMTQYIYLSSDFRLVGHIIESLFTDEFDCGLRCVRNKKCQSYNLYSDEFHSNKKCELSDQTRRSKPTDLQATKGCTYYGKGRETNTAIHQTFKQRLAMKSNKRVKTWKWSSKSIFSLFGIFSTCKRVTSPTLKVTVTNMDFSLSICFQRFQNNV